MSWLNKNQNLMDEQFSDFKTENKYEQVLKKEAEIADYYLNLENVSEAKSKDILEQLTHGYMYENTEQDPHINNKYIGELMDKHGLQADNSESQEQRLNFWQEASEKGYVKLKNPIYNKMLMKFNIQAPDQGIPEGAM
jgi:c-di-AMP phosphodiesterase-like protein|tara:strand:+ start:54 stop:467 length:414 start_codon:yes stop_codon:yes gene_type:complete